METGDQAMSESDSGVIYEKIQMAAKQIEQLADLVDDTCHVESLISIVQSLVDTEVTRMGMFQINELLTQTTSRI